MNMPLYLKAENLLLNEFQSNYQIVKDSPFHRHYVEEKIRHSWQVAGAGNGILRNEVWFQSCSESVLNAAKTAILLHDIYRFREIRGMYENKLKIDHGAKGAELLKQFAEFNSPLIVLPVKHHGHMIEDFYADPEYQMIQSESMKEAIAHIIFAVRDADKIANWNLLGNEFSNMRELWVDFPDDLSLEQGQISSQLWSDFCAMKIAPLSCIKTNADAIVSVICWLFDMNYRSAVVYCQRLNLFIKLTRVLKQLKVDPEKIKKINEIMTEYCFQKFSLEIDTN